MSSYLLDTTSNASVTYGQGKYVASASSEYLNVTYAAAWQAFNKVPHTGGATEWTSNSGYAAGAYTGSVVTVDTLGNAYAGEWIQLQNPASYILSSYSIQPSADSANSQSPVRWWVLGSRDGLNWTLLDSRSGITVWTNSGTQSFTASATQSYNYFRLVVNQVVSITLVSIAEWTLNGTEEGICVTNDSKVGVGIANPQRALEVAGDLIVGGTISGGAGMGSFRNRIINGDMRIAQRGTSNVVPSTDTEQIAYTVDRWPSDVRIVSGGGVITQTQQTLAASDTPYQLGLQYSLRHTATVGVTSYSYYGIMQKIESVNVADLMWGTSFGQPVTVSFWFRTNAPPGSSMNICIRSSAFNVNFNQNYTALGNGQWQYVTLTVPPPPNGTSWGTYTTLYLGGGQPGGFASIPGWSSSGNNWGLTGTYPWAQTAGNYIEFTGIQLEKGTVATPFEFRPFAQELALCMRYYQKSYDDGVAPGTVGQSYLQAYFTSTGGGSYSFPFPVRMRGTPVLTAYSINNGAAGYMYGPGPNASYAVSTAASQWGGEIYPSVSTYTVPNYYYFAWTASAEL
jgi:hypothetical protein